MAASDTISQMSVDSTASNDSKEPSGGIITAGDIRRRLSESFSAPKKQFKVRKFGICWKSRLILVPMMAGCAGMRTKLSTGS